MLLLQNIEHTATQNLITRKTEVKISRHTVIADFWEKKKLFFLILAKLFFLLDWMINACIIVYILYWIYIITHIF